MKKRSDSLRGIGFTTVSVDSVTKERMKELAGDTPICEFVRELVDDYSRDKQIPLSTGITSQSTERVLNGQVNDKLDAVYSLLKPLVSIFMNTEITSLDDVDRLFLAGVDFEDMTKAYQDERHEQNKLKIRDFIEWAARNKQPSLFENNNGESQPV